MPDKIITDTISRFQKELNNLERKVEREGRALQLEAKSFVDIFGTDIIATKNID